MRHRLFHAIVLVGAALPGCSDDASSSPATDASADTSQAADSASTTQDTSTGDGTSVDSADAVGDAPMDTKEEETCDDGCGDKCVPCIK